MHSVHSAQLISNISQPKNCHIFLPWLCLLLTLWFWNLSHHHCFYTYYTGKECRISSLYPSYVLSSHILYNELNYYQHLMRELSMKIRHSLFLICAHLSLSSLQSYLHSPSILSLQIPLSMLLCKPLIRSLILQSKPNQKVLNNNQKFVSFNYCGIWLRSGEIRKSWYVC